MKRKTRAILLGLTGILCVAGLVWMRARASWRSQVWARVPQGYSLALISPDGGTVVFCSDQDSDFFRTLNVSSGRFWDWSSTSEGLAGIQDIAFVSPSLLGYNAWSKDRPAFQLRRVADASLVQTFKGNAGTLFFDSNARLIESEKRLCLVNAKTFSIWDVASGQPLRQIALQGGHFDYRISPSNAISPDGQKVFRGLGNGLTIWNTQTGKQIGDWEVKVSPTPQPSGGFATFSPDGHLVVFGPPTTSPLPYTNWRVLDTTTGKLLWKCSSVTLSFSDDGQQVAVPLAAGCELRNSATGEVVKRLRSPRLGDGNILRFNSDWIYTLNSKNEVLRWRAR